VAYSMDPAYGKLKNGFLEALFEAQNDAVLLISEFDNGARVLYRLIVDGATGKIKKEEKIGEMGKSDLGKAFATIFGNMDLPEFFAVSDPLSGNYVVSHFNTAAPEKNKLIQVVMYDQEHHELSRVFYTPPGDRYKYVRFINVTFVSSDKLMILGRGFHSADKGSDIMLAEYDKNNSTFEFKAIPETKDSTTIGAVLKYNPFTKKLLLTAKTDDKDYDKSRYILCIIDPKTGSTEKTSLYSIPDEADQWLKDTYGKKYEFDGSPDAIYINRDGGFSIPSEDWKVTSYTSSSGSYSQSITMSILIMQFDKEGNRLGCFVVPKSYAVESSYTNMYIGGFTNQYKKYALISSGDKSYVLINDSPRNIERQEKKKDPISIHGINDCEAFYFPLSGTEPAPVRKYLFGESESKKDRSLSPFGASAYDKENDVLIVLQHHWEGRSQSASITWLKPQ